jgi:choline dehydrogenase-like flavoprotein
VNTQFDIIIIGSGAGGGTMAKALAASGAKILVLERGSSVPQEPGNWDPAAVWQERRYQTSERWLDSGGRPFAPYTHYNVGGNTKFWGGVLYRLRREDFNARELDEGATPQWPISYETLAPYYDRAEALYQVHGASDEDPTEPPRNAYPHPPVPHASNMAGLVEHLRALGLHPSSLPMGLIDPGLAGGCVLCSTCNSFPCQIQKKSDAEVCCVTSALAHPNVELWTNARAERLLTNPAGTAIDSVDVDHAGSRVRVSAPVVVVSCGAVNSAALLLKSANDKHPAGLANSSGLVGKRYMAHLATMMQSFHPTRINDDVFQKTVAINDFYLRGARTPVPLGQIQSQGRSHAPIVKNVAPILPMWFIKAWIARGVDWLAMSEDLPKDDNRVTVGADGRIRLQYRPNNVRAHKALVAEMRRIMRRLGFWWTVTFSMGNKNTTHQCGTLVFGDDPRTSVLDPFCRAHDLDNLFVVDASFFPSSAAVNPALTIIAQSLRVADHIQKH